MAQQLVSWSDDMKQSQRKLMSVYTHQNRFTLILLCFVSKIFAWSLERYTLISSTRREKESVYLFLSQVFQSYKGNPEFVFHSAH